MFSSPHSPCCANLWECAGLPELAPSGVASASPELCCGGASEKPARKKASDSLGQEPELMGPSTSSRQGDLSLFRPGDPVVGLAFLSPWVLLLLSVPHLSPYLGILLSPCPQLHPPAATSTR